MADSLENYQGPIDPSPLLPKLGPSYQDHPVLGPIVQALNAWQFKSAFQDLEALLAQPESDRHRISALRLKGEVLAQGYALAEALASFQTILTDLPEDRQALTLSLVLSYDLGWDYQDYLDRLIQVDPALAQRVAGILDLIQSQGDRTDLEEDWPRDLPVDTLALYGNRLEDDGSLSQALVDRLHKTLVLAQTYPQARIIVSGGAALSPFLEADRMQAWLVNAGLDPDRIIKDPYAKDTVGNVMGFVRIMEALDSQYVVAISSLSHLARAWMSLVVCAQAAGLQTKIYGAAPEPSGSLAQLPPDEVKYRVLTVFRSAQLMDYQDF